MARFAKLNGVNVALSQFRNPCPNLKIACPNLKMSLSAAEQPAQGRVQLATIFKSQLPPPSLTHKVYLYYGGRGQKCGQLYTCDRNSRPEFDSENGVCNLCVGESISGQRC